MAGFTESNITLDFPSPHWFRFEHSLPYSEVSAFHYKEMDACWVKNMGTDTAEFFAIELKDYTNGNISTTSSERVWDIVKKVVDTIQMYLSARWQQPFGQRLENEKSVDLHTGIHAAKFITIVDVAPSDTMLFQALKDSCMNRLKGYTKVWDGIQVHIVTKQQAQRHFAEFVK